MFRVIGDDAEMLDVGIGTASALVLNKSLILEKNVRITGIDIDQHYLSEGQKLIDNEGLQDRINLKCVPFEKHQGKYDVVFFASSFMLLADQNAALQHAKSMLKPKGMIVFTHT